MSYDLATEDLLELNADIYSTLMLYEPCFTNVAFE